MIHGMIFPEADFLSHLINIISVILPATSFGKNSFCLHFRQNDLVSVALLVKNFVDFLYLSKFLLFFT
jgi:hypothetical protein